MIEHAFRRVLGHVPGLPFLCLLSLAPAFPARLAGQILLSAGHYSQDFNALAKAGSAEWLDDLTLPGWYASRSSAPNGITNYSAGSGSSTTGGLYSFGEAASTDRALGSVASGGTGKIAYGLRLLNDTGLAQTDWTVSYAGEQWRAGGNAPQKISFSYRIGTGLTNADAAGDQNWTPVSSLDSLSPNTNAAQALNGNDPANQTGFTNVLLAGLVLSPGEELFLRWLDTDDSGYDDGLAVDNVTVCFAPAQTNDARASTDGSFSLLTYNTHGNGVENWSTNSYQVRAIGRELMFLKPDIITFNEIPQTNTWQMENWISAFLPGYYLATNSEGDGAIRNVIASRFPILRSQSWLHDADLSPFGCSNLFKRDLFEAEIAVPAFPQSLHVFCLHLKSGQDSASSALRAAETAAVSNFFVALYLPTNGLHPFTLSGDFNEDLVRPPTSNPQSIQRLISPATGLQLTSPLNPPTQSELTFSIQSGALSKRYDYILPCALLFTNVAACQVFRSDVLTNPPPPLRTNDDRTASDHLPVFVTFNNPYTRPFRVKSAGLSNQEFTLIWESLPGQSYRVEKSIDLVRWTVVADSLLATGSNFTFATNTSGSPAFYRVGRAF